MIENEEGTKDGGQESVEETDQPNTRTSSLGDSLRSLRLRRYHSSSHSESIPEAEATHLKDEGSNREIKGGNVEDEAIDNEKLQVSLDELSQEIRRLGREMFRTSRVAERNQEIFDEAISEIRQLSSTVALIPAQYNEAIGSAKFEARAELCRDLLRMSDTLEASLLAADQLISQLQNRVNQLLTNGLAQRLAFQFSTTRQLRDSLVGSLTAMKQLRDGQQLLAERLRTILRTAGVRGIETSGCIFDPQIHRAVSVAEYTNLPAGTIVSEELKGYTLDGRILRYAEVIVAK
jgi:hypothetical protein